MTQAASDPGHPTGDEELMVRYARREGKQVVTMRCVQRDGACVVECHVYPVNSLRVEPLDAGPYSFPDFRAASDFVEEASLALEYMGCEIT